MTPEFERMKNDPDLESRPGPGGTLIFNDGEQYCIVGPDFVNMDESNCYAFGATIDEALSNFVFKERQNSPRRR